MRTSFRLFILCLALGRLFTASSAKAQQPVFAQENYYDSGASGYVPARPQAIYTNQAAYDPLASAEYYGQPNDLQSGSIQPSYGGYYDGGYEYETPVFVDDSYNVGTSGLRCGNWFVTGWLDQGFAYNARKPNNKSNMPLKFNDRSDEYQLNQLYVAFGRNVANSGSRVDIGGRIDLLYGADYLWTSAIGLETRKVDRNGYHQQDPSVLLSQWNKNKSTPPYDSSSRLGLAAPQLYAELYLPIHYGLNIKAGHFYSIMGYESVMSPENFFYSHSYAMMYGEPMTHTGFLFSQRLTQRLTGIFGITRGWDTWEDPNGKLSYLAGVRWNSFDQRTELSFVAGSGNETINNNPAFPSRSNEGANRTHYSLVLAHRLTPNLKLVTQHDLGYEKNAAYELHNMTPVAVNGHWYSLSQYAIYQLTDNLSVGVRGEWFRDVNSSRILKYYPVRTFDGAGNKTQYVDGRDYSNVTIGLNWKPVNYLIIRPEARWDWSGVQLLDGNGTPVTGGAYSFFNKKSQFTSSISAILTY
ncbi:MAG: porin [Planctomycetaceae bacterium]|jgi:hypothetical protein|nr:porin [Planctomycetaceae bacterium]